MTRTGCFAGAAFAVLALGASPIHADDCGDTAGPTGERVSCGCGDEVMTDTVLHESDAVVIERCVGTGLIITRSSVTLDCDGLKIRGGPGGPNETGVRIFTNTHNAVVQRCSISGFTSGIRLDPGVRKNQVLYNTLNNHAFFGVELNSSAQDNEVVDNEIYENGIAGIQINSSGRNNRILGNMIYRNPVGIQFNSGAQGNEVRLNQITALSEADQIEATTAIQFNSEASDNDVVSNTMDGGDFGINFNSRATRNAVMSNFVTGASLAAIRFGPEGEKNRISDNFVSDNRGEGIRLEEMTADNLLRRNRAYGNGIDGIEVCGPGNRLLRNEALFSGDLDICAVEGNTDDGNVGTDVTFDCPVPPQCEELL